MAGDTLPELAGGDRDTLAGVDVDVVVDVGETRVLDVVVRSFYDEHVFLQFSVCTMLSLHMALYVVDYSSDQIYNRANFTASFIVPCTA